MLRHRHLAASLIAAALALGAAAEAAPLMPSLPGLAATEVASETVHRVGFGDRLNRARDRAGRAEVRSSRRLRAAAAAHAEDMARNGYFSHTGRDGSTSSDRAREANCRCRAVAENIAMGQRSAREVFRAWMNSPDHRENMLGRGYRNFGLGRSGNTWVLVMADRG